MSLRDVLVVLKGILFTWVPLRDYGPKRGSFESLGFRVWGLGFEVEGFRGPIKDFCKGPGVLTGI